MPYNTRRKSLSLPSLGIQLPSGSRGREAKTHHDQPPQKKVKRIHTINTTTPPPSPPPEGPISHDGINDDIVSGVLDVLERSGNRPHTVKELAALLSPVLEIVENSANPHAIISSRLNAYLKRGFPASGRPCLLAKELITSHPRRIYFYLATCPAQPIVENDPSSSSSPPIIPPRRSAASPVSDDDGDAAAAAEDMRRRTQLSPSPEVDLSSPEFDDDDDNCHGTHYHHHNHHRHHYHHLPRHVRQVISPTERKGILSPTLEGDEREFTQSAIQLKQRSVSRAFEEQRRLKRAREPEVETEKGEGTEGGVHEEGRESEDAAALLGYAVPPPHSASIIDVALTAFDVRGAHVELDRVKKDGGDVREGQGEPTLNAEGETVAISKQQLDHGVGIGIGTVMGMGLATGDDMLAGFRYWSSADLQSPESIELDELEYLLGAGFE